MFNQRMPGISPGPILTLCTLGQGRCDSEPLGSHLYKWLVTVRKGRHTWHRTWPEVCGYSLFFLAAPHGLQDLSSPTRDRACTPCSGSEESQPLGCQGSPCVDILIILEGVSLPAVCLSPLAPCFTPASIVRPESPFQIPN